MTKLIDVQTHHEISQFLFQEAALLDDWQFRDWLDVMSEDVLYTMRTCANAQTRDRRRSVQPPTTWIFHDDKFQLERRIARLETGMAWAEEPPSRTRHLLTNIQVTQGESDQEFQVRSNYILYRQQKERDETYYVGKREDTIRRVEGGLGFEIARRNIVLDQVVLTSHNISVLF